MPFLKPLKGPTRTMLIEATTEKCGYRSTVFLGSGKEYTGEWQNNKKHGKGFQIWTKSGTFYSGEWKFGKPDGFGCYGVTLSKSKECVPKYIGEWKNGMKHGNGEWFFKNSSIYQGEWRNNQRQGIGIINYENGDKYKGEWKKDKRNGLGIFQYANGNIFEGSWKNGMKHGEGNFYYCESKQIYKGLWVKGEAKCGTIFDYDEDSRKIPIPKQQLADIEKVLKEALSPYQDQL